MGLFEKFKEIFTEPAGEDEEKEEELKVEQIKKEPTPSRTEKKVTETRREREEKIGTYKEEVDFEEKKVEEKEEIPKTPVFFTDNDFADLEMEKPKKIEKKVEEEVRPKREERKQQPYGGHYSGTYTSTSILTTEKPSFKPTPIISPIYGILDKNYSKDDIIEKKDVHPTHASDGMVQDKFDEVRNKAYGTLENELEETMYDDGSNSRVVRNKGVEEDIDLFDELEKEDTEKKVRLEDTSELAKTVKEQEKNIRELDEITMDLTKELDNLLLKKESFNSKKEKIEKASKKEESDTPLTENELFNLIDSMYEEGKED